MITLQEIKTKCQKYWQAQHIQKSLLMKTSLFPIIITTIRFSAKELSEQFLVIRENLQQLQLHSKEQKAFGYTILYRVIQHRQLGRQTIPESIGFETLDDFLKFIQLKEVCRRFEQTSKIILEAIPALSSWLSENTAKVLVYQEQWPKLLSVGQFLQNNPNPGYYLRELPIPGIDSKFVEQHKTILRELLDILLPEESIASHFQSFQYHGFERRYGFKYPEPLIRFRILDKSLYLSGLHDVSLPLSDFKKLDINCLNIFITENKINGLSFPPMEHSVIIFGLGYGIQSLKDIAWFKNKAIFYWGDIDTHGFSILSQLRSYYPQVKSLLMTEETLHTFQFLAVEEPQEKRCFASLPNLTKNEQQLYQELQKNTYGKNIRIEQERIDFKYVIQYIRLANENSENFQKNCKRT